MMKGTFRRKFYDTGYTAFKGQEKEGAASLARKTNQHHEPANWMSALAQATPKFRGILR